MASPARKPQSPKRKKTPSKKPAVRKRLPLALWLPPLCIAALTLLFFLPALQNGFVWDDESNIEENLSYRGLGWNRLRWMFTTLLMGHYQPLSWITLGSDYLIWGMNPFVRMYHPMYAREWAETKQEHAGATGIWSPPVELAERGTELIIRVDLPCAWSQVSS